MIALSYVPKSMSLQIQKMLDFMLGEITLAKKCSPPSFHPNRGTFWERVQRRGKNISKLKPYRLRLVSKIK